MKEINKELIFEIVSYAYKRGFKDGHNMYLPEEEYIDDKDLEYIVEPAINEIKSHLTSKQ